MYKNSIYNKEHFGYFDFKSTLMLVFDNLFRISLNYSVNVILSRKC